MTRAELDAMIAERDPGPGSTGTPHLLTTVAPEGHGLHLVWHSWLAVHLHLNG